MTTAAWPVWGAQLNGVHATAADIQRRALYRIPKIYRVSVQFVLMTTLTADTFISGTVIGRVFQQDYAYAASAATFATLLLLALLVPTVLLIGACVELEEPFGDNLMDMPGLANVRSAAEVSLNIVAPHPTCRLAMHEAMDVDLSHLGGAVRAMRDSQTAANTSPSTRPRLTPRTSARAASPPPGNMSA
jgi:hypothetical protein